MNSDRYEVTPSDYGVWVKDKNKGRSRFVRCTPEELASIDLASKLEKTQRAFAQGQHEHMTLYRMPDGELGVPPQPDMIPEGATAFTVNNLAEADRACREMREQMAEKYHDEGEFTEMMEEVMGSPRKVLIDRISQAGSRMERDVIREMIGQLDREESDRRKVEVETRFQWRNS